MKATGIVRRIDDLGRVVIPKEIRRTMRIREGDSLEIYTANEGTIIFKKYSPISELRTFAQEYADAIYETLGTPCCIADRDEIVAVSGVAKKAYRERRLTIEAEELMQQRKTVIEKLEATLELVAGQYEQVKSYAAVPIFSNGEVIGALFIFSKVHFIGDIEQKVIETAANFLGKQMTH